jgi:threonine aldolase
VRKAFGGGMRQAGFLAAAGIYALNNNITRLKDDHVRAAGLGKALSGVSWVKSMMPVDTNIVIFSVIDKVTPEQVLAKLAEHEIKAIRFGAQEIRLVTHLDFDDRMLEKTITTIKKLSL